MWYKVVQKPLGKRVIVSEHMHPYIISGTGSNFLTLVIFGISITNAFFQKITPDRSTTASFITSKTSDNGFILYTND